MLVYPLDEPVGTRNRAIQSVIYLTIDIYSTNSDLPFMDSVYLAIGLCTDLSQTISSQSIADCLGKPFPNDVASRRATLFHIYALQPGRE